MALTNTSKPTTTLSNAAKVKSFETWETITTTWATETRTWAECESNYDNVAKPVSSTSVTKSASTFANDSGIGTLSWSNPTNAGSLDGSYAARSSASTATTNYLKATNFGFSIPSDATITGIKVEIAKFTSLSSIYDSSVKLVKTGTIAGNNKSKFDWPTTIQYISYGGSTDLWGLSFSPADINASTFGVAIAAVFGTGGLKTANIDHIQITVYYSYTGSPITNSSKPS